MMKGRHGALEPSDMDGDDDVLLNDAAENEDTVPHSNNKHASVHVRGGSSTSKKLVFFAVTLTCVVGLAALGVVLHHYHGNNGNAAAPFNLSECELQQCNGTSVHVPGLGTLIGNTPDGTSVASFKGIPFGKAPIGTRRWQPPQPYGSWEHEGVRNATEYGFRCAQSFSIPGYSPPVSEDCLFLNVYTPVEALCKGPAAALPVMVWIYGGGYWSGESNDYDGSTLVNASGNSVIVVTLNYRVAQFGFLASPAIKAWSTDSSAGNFGIQDQRLAIRWVKERISAFGGDGNAITIFGQSAGGNSVINHLAAPASGGGLFRAAIIESGAYDTGAQTLEQATANYNNLLSYTNCSTVECLSELSTSTILAAFTCNANCGWGPVVDGVELTAAPTDLIARKTYNNKVNVLLGSNRDEYASWFIKAVPSNLTETGYDEMMMNHTTWNATQRMDIKRIYAWNGSYVYPPLDRLGVYSQWWWTYTRVFTDTVPGNGACGVRWLAELLFRGGTPSIHTYMFSQPTVCDVLRGGVAMCTLEMAAVPGTAITAAQAVTVPHAMEVSYAFGTTSWFPPGEQIGLSLTMSSYWSNFAKSRGGDPNGPGLPRWEAFNIESDLSQQLEESNGPGGGVRSIPRVRKAACDWQSVNPVQTTI